MSLPTFFKEMTPELAKQAEEELHETPQVRTEGLKEFRRLLEATEISDCRFEDELLLQFLRVKKFDVKKSVNVLRNYINFQRKHFGVYTYLRPSQLKHIIEMNIFSFTYYRLPNNSYAALVRVGNYDPSAASVVDVIACALTWTEIIFGCQSTQISGGCSIVDLRGANFEQIKALFSFSFVKFLVTTMKDCYPLRMRGFHFINDPYILRFVYGVVKHLGSKKIFERIHFHGSDLNTFHEHVPKEVLPEDFGGTAEPMDKKVLDDIFYSHEDFIMSLSKYALKTTK